MPKIIVFHYSEGGKLSKICPNELEDVKYRFRDILQYYPDVKFNGIYVNEEGRGISDWEAPNTKVVNEIIETVTGMPPIDGTIIVERII